MPCAGGMRASSSRAMSIGGIAPPGHYCGQLAGLVVCLRACKNADPHALSVCLRAALLLLDVIGSYTHGPHHNNDLHRQRRSPPRPSSQFCKSWPVLLGLIGEDMLAGWMARMARMVGWLLAGTASRHTYSAVRVYEPLPAYLLPACLPTSLPASQPDGALSR